MNSPQYFHNEELIYTAGASLTLGEFYGTYSILKLSLKPPVEIDIFLDRDNPCSYGIYSRHHYLRKIDVYVPSPIIDNTKEHETKKVMFI